MTMFPLKMLCLAGLVAAAASCQLPTLFVERIEDHVEMRITADREAIGPSDSVALYVELVSNSERRMVLRVQGGSCLWRAYAMETEVAIYPEVWTIRPSGRFECQQADDLRLSLGSGEVVHLGTVHWDGTVMTPAGAQRLAEGIYQIHAMIEPHDVWIDGEKYESELGEINADTVTVQLIE